MNYRWGLLLIIPLLVYLYYQVDPSTSVYFPGCPFHLLTGYDCPGCGSQRAVHHLLHLDLGLAIRYNPLVIPAILLFIYYLMVKTINRVRPSWQVKNILKAPATPVISGSIVLAFWIIRNLPFYPLQH